MQLNDLIKNITPDMQGISLLSDYLGYQLGKNPLNPSSDWAMLFSKQTDKSQAIIAAKSVSNLTIETPTRDIRKMWMELHEFSETLTAQFTVQVGVFVGNQRLVFFRMKDGNRDERLDINVATADKSLYKDALNYLMENQISIEVDPFGFGSNIVVSFDKVFKKELNNSFLLMVTLYRKLLSELITAHQDLREELAPLLLSEKAKMGIKMRNMTDLVEDETYAPILSTVVDTILLRQLMRRFLEGYYGSNAFELSEISLGVEAGTMDAKIAEIAKHIENQTSTDDTKLKKAVNSKNKLSDGQLDLFGEVEDVTPYTVEEVDSEEVKDAAQMALDQFKLVYAGDLFAGSISEVADQIELKLAENYAKFYAEMWLDTSSEKYSFRYEDVPPEALEKQYENSMSQSIQIRMADGHPEVGYGEDVEEQKSKGAYYTRSEFVEYIVKQSVGPVFEERFQKLKQAVATDYDVENAVQELLDIKIADLTSGGGSFLRGAFVYLSSKHDLIASLNYKEELVVKYPMLAGNDEGIAAWEAHLLNNVIYGVDIDYKAVMISSLTLILTSLQHKQDKRLPQLIGKTLINQNSLINAVPFEMRASFFAQNRKDIKKLLSLKKSEDFSLFDQLRQQLQGKAKRLVDDIFGENSEFLHVESLELNIPEVFFDDEGVLLENGGFDAIIGNPPWETWKPNSDEFFGSYDERYSKYGLKKAEKAKIQKELIEKIPSLEDKWKEVQQRFEAGSQYFRSPQAYSYQSWKVDGKKTGTDLNLYKVASERFMQVLKKDGLLSIVVPDNLMTDLGSSGIRHLLFDQNSVLEFLSFINRELIFKSVDSRYKFAVLTVQATPNVQDYFDAFFYQTSLDNLDDARYKFKYDLSYVKETNPEMYSIAEPQSKEAFDAYKKIRSSFDSMKQTGILKFGRDFDRTNDTKYFEPIFDSEVPLYEGKLMNQFELMGLDGSVNPDGLIAKKQSVTEGVSLEAAKKKAGEAVLGWRLAYRSVASATNKRSMIATLLPPLTATANSLAVQKNVGVSLKAALFYLGVLNSYTVDYFLRMMVTTNMTQNFVLQTPMPIFDETNIQHVELSKISEALLLKSGQTYGALLQEQSIDDDLRNTDWDHLRAESDARVAMLFKLSRQELITILQSFETAKHKDTVQKEAQMIIEEFERLEK